MRNKLYYIAFFYSSLVIVFTFLYFIIVNKVPISIGVFLPTIFISLIVFFGVSSIKNKKVVKFLTDRYRRFLNTKEEDVDYMGIPVDKERDRTLHDYIIARPILRNIVIMFCSVVILYYFLQITLELAIN